MPAFVDGFPDVVALGEGDGEAAVLAAASAAALVADRLGLGLGLGLGDGVAVAVVACALLGALALASCGAAAVLVVVDDGDGVGAAVGDGVGAGVVVAAVGAAVEVAWLCCVAVPLVAVLVAGLDCVPAVGVLPPDGWEVAAVPAPPVAEPAALVLVPEGGGSAVLVFGVVCEVVLEGALWVVVVDPAPLVPPPLPVSLVVVVWLLPGWLLPPGLEETVGSGGVSAERTSGMATGARLRPTAAMTATSG